MELSQAGLDFAKKWEGYRERAYDDGGGVMTIGFGTTRYFGITPVKLGDRTTMAEAETYMRHDLRWAVDTVNQNVSVPLTQEQFDALVSFVYNVGESAFEESTLLRKLNTGDYGGAANEFVRWNKDNGRIIPGLTHRRSDEQDLFLSGGDPRVKKILDDAAEWSNSLKDAPPPEPYTGDKDSSKKG